MNSDAHPSKVDSDLADRLDTLFDENDGAASPAGNKTTGGDPLDELKSLVMSIEWEITDDVMERFLSQIDAVKTHFEADRILVMFLQLLGSLGLYVKTNKGKAHPNAFKLLNSVYGSFEKAARQGGISPSEKKKLLYIELNKYKELKEQIESTREPEASPPRMVEAPSRPKGASAGQGSGAAAGGAADDPVTRRYVETVVENLKSSILQELAAIRKDIAKMAKTK